MASMSIGPPRGSPSVDCRTSAASCTAATSSACRRRGPRAECRAARRPGWAAVPPTNARRRSRRRPGRPVSASWAAKSASVCVPPEVRSRARDRGGDGAAVHRVRIDGELVERGRERGLNDEVALDRELGRSPVGENVARCPRRPAARRCGSRWREPGPSTRRSRRRRERAARRSGAASPRRAPRASSARQPATTPGTVTVCAPCLGIRSSRGRARRRRCRPGRLRRTARR